MAAKLANRFSLCLFSVQFDGEKPDKITRGACACNDDKVIFENPLNWTTRSFILAKQREYENGPPTPEPSGELSCEAATGKGRFQTVKFIGTRASGHPSWPGVA